MEPMGDEEYETALLLRFPSAEHAVAQHRRLLDSAAADGIPAHVTVIYPFIPSARLTDEEHARMDDLLAAQAPCRLSGRTTSWFGDRVLYVALDDVEAVHALTAQLVTAFPDFPPYAGEIAVEDVVPHLTVGHDRPFDELRAAERAVHASLPFEDLIDHVELWSGPARSGRTEPRPWRHIRSYRLGGQR